MDKRNGISPPAGSDAIDPASIAAAEPAVAGSSVVFCGDPARVAAGFAMALQLMGLDAPAQDVSENDGNEGKRE